MINLFADAKNAIIIALLILLLISGATIYSLRKQNINYKAAQVASTAIYKAKQEDLNRAYKQGEIAQKKTDTKVEQINQHKLSEDCDENFNYTFNNMKNYRR